MSVFPEREKPSDEKRRGFSAIGAICGALIGTGLAVAFGPTEGQLVVSVVAGGLILGFFPVDWRVIFYGLK